MKTTNSRAAQNGQAKKTDTENGAENTTILTGKEEVKILALPVSPIDERTRKIAELQKLTHQRHLLVENEKELHGFNFGSDKMRDSLEITDSDNNVWTTSNTYIIVKVVEELKKEFAAKIAEISNQLLTATI